MSVTYGYDLKENDDMIAAPVQTVETISRFALPGAAMVNHLPFCTSFPVTRSIHVMVCSQIGSVRHIPSWVPWFSYEPLAQMGRNLSQRVRNEPIDFVKNAMVCGDYA
jgi:hypothetical protein